ncbi:hypothetical protein ACWDSJ_22855 [Nocardia sp. NPDC003482]
MTNLRAALIMMSIGAALCGPALGAGAVSAAPPKKTKGTQVSVDAKATATRNFIEISGSGTCKAGGVDLEVRAVQDKMAGRVRKHSLFTCDGKSHPWKVRFAGSDANPYGEEGTDEWKPGPVTVRAVLYRAETDEEKAEIETTVTIETK